MKIEFDPAKRDATIERRGLDMADVSDFFAGATITIEDDRYDYGEPRFISIGFQLDRMVIVAWTPRDDARRIISMRKANDREQGRYCPRFE